MIFRFRLYRTGKGAGGYLMKRDYEAERLAQERGMRDRYWCCAERIGAKHGPGCPQAAKYRRA